MHTLTALSSVPSPYQPLSVQSNAQTPSMLSSLGSSLGPTGSIIRIVDRLQQRILRVLLGTGPSRGARRAEEDSRHRSVKVLDLLQHSAELGNLDALYTLGYISLVRAPQSLIESPNAPQFPPTSHFPSKPKLAFDYFLQHAELTGNATSQSHLAFFYATGYREVVPVDQARAQLYYTFAANGGDKGAQMALGYRYWSGIGTLEDCERASDWYEHAAEQTMAKYRSGPVGGLTLPLTPTRLSDLEGGIYGPGASVASTGLQSHRAAIKASASRQSGETWEDVLDYYMVCSLRQCTSFSSSFITSSMPTEERPTLHIVWANCSTKVAFTRAQAVLRLVVKVLERFPATMFVQGSISNLLPARSGLAILPTLCTTVLRRPGSMLAKMFLLDTLLRVLAISVGCTCAARVSTRIWPWPGCGSNAVWNSTTVNVTTDWDF